MRVCPITCSNKFELFYTSSHGKVMTSDQRILPGILQKIIFKSSGVVANLEEFSEEKLSQIYQSEYILNTSGAEEHIFYTSQGSISRSKVYFDWIMPFINMDFKSLVEIGSGEGRVLQKVAEGFPNLDVTGFDGSNKAVDLAQKKGLRISQKLIFEQEVLPKADIYLLLGVLEHIENIESFLANIINSINDRGRLILSIPIQDYLAYDIFFADHIWHFTSSQFEAFLNRMGLDVIHKDIKHPINHGFGLFVCEKVGISSNNFIPDSKTHKDNLQYWDSCFKNVNELIRKYIDRKITLFGASEILTLFMANTLLNDVKIDACIDDTKPEGMLKHGIPVYPSSWLEHNQTDLLLLAVNKKYYPMIEEKFKHLNLNIQPIY
jgi:2-polyprenyl-3-methyl-5-hydroxy-6-metoxy-1,4-benzoquinol methylase